MEARARAIFTESVLQYVFKMLLRMELDKTYYMRRHIEKNWAGK